MRLAIKACKLSGRNFRSLFEVLLFVRFEEERRIDRVRAIFFTQFKGKQSHERNHAPPLENTAVSI